MENGGCGRPGEGTNRIKSMEAGQPMRVLGRDVAIAEGGGGNVVGTDGILFFDKQWGAYQRSFEQKSSIKDGTMRDWR